MLLIKDTLGIVTHLCTIQISTRTGFKPYLKVLNKQLETVPVTLLKNTVPVTLLLCILGIFRRTLFQCETLILCKNTENCSSVKH